MPSWPRRACKRTCGTRTEGSQLFMATRVSHSCSAAERAAWCSSKGSLRLRLLDEALDFRWDMS